MTHFIARYSGILFAFLVIGFASAILYESGRYFGLIDSSPSALVQFVTGHLVAFTLFAIVSLLIVLATALPVLIVKFESLCKVLVDVEAQDSIAVKPQLIQERPSSVRGGTLVKRPPNGSIVAVGGHE